MAKWREQFCLRPTKLEELHDRISDEEMKALMIDCANHCYAFVSILFATQGANDIVDKLKENDQVPQWDEPEMPSGLIEATKHLPAILEHLSRATT